MKTSNDKSISRRQQSIIHPEQPHSEDIASHSLEALMERYGVPGVSISVIRDFEVHWSQGYGIADVESGTEVNSETLFQAASISKPVAAMAVLRAAETGELGLDDDIDTILKSWHLPESPHTRDRPVTPRGLTSHTAGIVDGWYPGYHPDAPLPTLTQILDGAKPANVEPTKLVRPPMTAYQYSGGGATLMQLALADATGRPFADYLQEEILDPIGMTNSTFVQPLPVERDQNAARGHGESGQAMDAKWHVYPELAAAGLWTTSTDLAKFAIEVQKSVHGKANHVLSRTTMDEMLSPVGIGDFAVGFIISKRGQGWYFSHTGGNWGFRCALAAHKVKGYGYVVMTNGDLGGHVMEELGRRIESAYGFDSLDKPVG